MIEPLEVNTIILKANEMKRAGIKADDHEIVAALIIDKLNEVINHLNQESKDEL